MSIRLVPLLLSTAMLYALGAGVASLPYRPFAAPEPQANAADANIPTLPTVVVHADALAALMPTVTLPTVSVTPSVSEIAAARALDDRALGAGTVVVALHAIGGGMAPRSSGLEMPYYSFGKSVYRLRKE